MPSVKDDPGLESNVTIIVSAAVSRVERGALVDRGANGGILGNDARVILQHQQVVNVTGIDNHELNSLKMVDATAKVTTQLGDVILIMRQYAYLGVYRTIHSAGQIEYYKNIVDDRSMKCGGKQHIRTNDGYIIPLDIINGLPYMKMTPNTDQEYRDLPHVILTSGDEWNPTVIDNTITDTDDWYNTIKELSDGLIHSPFDQFGRYRRRETIPQGNEPEVEINEHHTDVDPVQRFRCAFHEASNLNQVYICEHDYLDVETFHSEIGDNKDGDDAKHIEAPSGRTKKKPMDYERYKPYFLHVSTEKIRRTFQNTTQNAVNVMAGNKIQQTLQSPYPAHNVWRRNEPVATDTIFAEVPAVDTGGQTMAQIYVGRKSLVIDVYGMSSTKEFVNTLEDTIRKRGAMDKLISDSAKVEISQRVKDVLRAFCIDDWQSEPYYQHQNFAEHRWKFLKRNVQWIMNNRNVDPNAWLLATQWVADIMNHTAEKSLGWRIPISLLDGQTHDISILLIFIFWDIVYCRRYEDHSYKGQIGSVKSNEIRGRFVGFSWSVGHALTFKILTDDSKKIIHRSRVRLAKSGENNLKLDVEAGAVPERVYIHSHHDDTQGTSRLPTVDLTNNPFTIEHDEPFESRVNQGEEPDVDGTPPDSTFSNLDDPTPLDDPPLRDLPTVETVPDEEDTDEVPPHIRTDPRADPNDPDSHLDFTWQSLRTENPTVQGLPPEEMAGRTFLMPPAEDGSRVRAQIISRVQEHKRDLEAHPDLVRFKCLVNNDYEEVVHYNDIVDFIEQDQTWDGTWHFRRVLQHEGPLKRNDKKYKGSRYNVLVEWETGEKTWEPLTTVDKVGVYDTDPVTLAIYARENNLLDTPGWKLKGMKKLAKTQKRIERHANQAKLHSYRTKPIYMYGILVPRNYEQAVEIDKANGNTYWQDATALELGQIDDYNAFLDKGKGYDPGPAFKKIRCHMVYAVKHDGRRKARFVAGGHLTDTPIDSVYSSVVSLRGVRLLAFVSELNDLEIWATDIGNAYLESYTKERVYIKAGPEFGERERHTLIIIKALYGLKSSGVRWHERLADVLREMGFSISKAEPDIWMRDKGDHYEYIAVYVDDLLLIGKDPQVIVDILSKTYKFKLKGTGPIEFHLGCDFFRDGEGNLCYAPRKYIEKTLDNYKRIFGRYPKEAVSPLVKGDHPELDTSDLLDEEQIKIYQSLIGSLQWAIQLGRFDIATATMTMSRYRAAPRQGHLERVMRICGYLSKMRHAVLRIRTEEPDYSDIPLKEHDWKYSCYPGAKEEIPHDAPTPRGKGVTSTSFFDANLYHDLISGRSVTGILHLLNKTPIDWFSKLQATVETATFGSEYVAARTSTEQIIDLRTTLRYLGVPINGSSMVFGDNESVVNSASQPYSKLHKRHNALSYHRTREAVAAGITRIHHIPGKKNPADILSKHWDYPTIWPILQPLLFWEGDTADIHKASRSNSKDREQSDGGTSSSRQTTSS